MKGVRMKRMMFIALGIMIMLAAGCKDKAADKDTAQEAAKEAAQEAPMDHPAH